MIDNDTDVPPTSTTTLSFVLIEKFLSKIIKWKHLHSLVVKQLECGVVLTDYEKIKPNRIKFSYLKFPRIFPLLVSNGLSNIEKL